MAENKTLPTRENPTSYLEAVEPARRREEGLLLLDRFRQWTSIEPVMWGNSLIGFGKYRYHYKSGRKGEYFLTGFSPRKSAISVYIMPGFSKYEALLSHLGKHKHSVSCLYLTNLSKVDISVLEELVVSSVDEMKLIYPNWTADAFARLES